MFCEVLVEVAACGITHNELDWPIWTCRAGHQRTAVIPGQEVSGVVARLGFDVLPPHDWIDPVSGALDVPGFGRVPPLQFHRAEQGVFAYGALGNRAAVIVFELDRSPREEPRDDNVDEPPMSLAAYKPPGWPSRRCLYL